MTLEESRVCAAAREKEDEKKSSGVLMALLPYLTILNLETDNHQWSEITKVYVPGIQVL